MDTLETQDLEDLSTLFDTYKGLQKLAETDTATQTVVETGTEIFNVLVQRRLATPTVAMALFIVGASIASSGAKLYDFTDTEAKENAPAAAGGLVGASMIFGAGKIMDHYAGV